MNTDIWDTPVPGCGRTPAIVLCNPKYGVNVGGAYRAAACWGFEQLWVAGSRFEPDIIKRLPREERMRVYRGEVELYQTSPIMDVIDYYFSHPPDRQVTPVCVEVGDDHEVLTLEWEHPENAVYFFGPEDGSVSGFMRSRCHRFLLLPSSHCMNLAATVNCIGMHRRLSRQYRGLESVRAASAVLLEERG